VKLKPKVVSILFKNSARTAKNTPHFTITEIHWLTLFKEMIAVYSENHTKLINTKSRVSKSFLKQVVHVVTTDLLNSY
jgi:hypothetical protein